MPENKRSGSKTKEEETRAWCEFDESAEKLVAAIEGGDPEPAIKSASDKFRKKLDAYKAIAAKK